MIEYYCRICDPFGQTVTDHSTNKHRADLADLADLDAIDEANTKARRNAAQRARYDAMRSVGMRRTPYGWE